MLLYYIAIMKVRIAAMITEESYKKLREAAFKQHVSMSTLVQQALDPATPIKTIVEVKSAIKDSPVKQRGELNSEDYT